MMVGAIANRWLAAAISITVLLFILPGCSNTLSQEDSLTLQRVRESVMPFILGYPASHFQFPGSYQEMIDEGFEPPINPHTGKPMIDTGTSEYIPDKSPGNFHYLPVTDRHGQVINFSVFVFGEKGLIRHIRPSPFAAR